jgi:glycerol-3-phosphate dehydrogenase (NAD(P)+)
MTANEGEPGRVLVLGNGGWGTALALVLRGRGCDVRVWGHDAPYSREIEETRRNPRFLAGVELPAGIRFGGDAAELARGVSAVFSVVPTQFLRGVLRVLAPDIPRGALLVSCSKGFERGTFELPSRIIASVLPPAPLAVLSGPSHAEEVSRGLPTTVVAASEPPGHALEVQRLLAGPRFRTYSSPDPLGVEIGGASKNVIALAAGISDGLGFGDNARAGLMTRGLSEITRLGVALGARAETFAGLSGIGDLIATCTSLHSRNHSVGLRLGKGEKLAAILGSMSAVVEGVETTRSIHDLAGKLGLELPITNEVHSVLFDGKDPGAAVESLMSRGAKNEAPFSR